MNGKYFQFISFTYTNVFISDTINKNKKKTVRIRITRPNV